MKNLPPILRIRKAVEEVQPIGGIPMPPQPIPPEPPKSGKPIDIDTPFNKELRKEVPDLSDAEYRVWLETYYKKNKRRARVEYSGHYWVIRSLGRGSGYTPRYWTSFGSNVKGWDFFQSAITYDGYEQAFQAVEDDRIVERNIKAYPPEERPLIAIVKVWYTSPSDSASGGYRIKEEEVHPITSAPLTIETPIANPPQLRFGQTSYQIKRWDTQAVIYQADNVGSLKECVEKAVREDANLWYADLVNADLGGANLGGASLGYANFEHSYLVDANLRGANLERANLWRANLERANLLDAHLWGANLWYANLRDANLEGANLWYANLVGTIYERKSIEETMKVPTIETPIANPPELRFGVLYRNWKVVIGVGNPRYLTPYMTLADHPGAAYAFNTKEGAMAFAFRYTGASSDDIFIVDQQTDYLADGGGWRAKVFSCYDIHGNPVETPLSLNRSGGDKPPIETPIVNAPELRFGQQRKAVSHLGYHVRKKDAPLYLLIEGGQIHWIDAIEDAECRTSLLKAVELGYRYLTWEEGFYVVYVESQMRGSEWYHKTVAAFDSLGDPIDKSVVGEGSSPPTIETPIANPPELRFGQSTWWGVENARGTFMGSPDDEASRGIWGGGTKIFPTSLMVGFIDWWVNSEQVAKKRAELWTRKFYNMTWARGGLKAVPLEYDEGGRCWVKKEKPTVETPIANPPELRFGKKGRG